VSESIEGSGRTHARKSRHDTRVFNGWADRLNCFEGKRKNVVMNYSPPKLDSKTTKEIEAAETKQRPTLFLVTMRKGIQTIATVELADFETNTASINRCHIHRGELIHQREEIDIRSKQQQRDP
jgi:hypothetical protein